MRRLSGLLAAAALVLAGALVAVGPADAAAPSDASSVAPSAAERGVRFTRHACPNWVWFGPRTWDAGCGVYGITVLGDRGATIDLGFSSILCSPGASYSASVAAYFRNLRASLRQNGWRFDRTSRIARPAGSATTYRRQTISFHTGRGGNGQQGVGTFDYDFSTTVDGLSYCYQRSIARYANRPAWNAQKGTLARVERSFAYSGPGAYEDQT